MNSKYLFAILKLLTLFTIASNILAYNNFVDPTNGQDGSLNVVGAGRSIASEEARFGGMYNGSGQSGGMPVQRNAQNSNSFAPQPATANPAPAPASSSGGGMSSQGIAQIMATNPQIKALVQQALNSGDQAKIQQILTLLQAFSGGQGGSGGAAPGQSSSGSAPPSGLPPHCSAPKYNTMVNAVKGIPMAMEKHLATSSEFKIFINLQYSFSSESLYI